jgi:site-specific recombinase XerD
MGDLILHKSAGALAEATPVDSRKPVAVYLASLGSAASRRSMLSSLNVIARLMTDGRLDAQTFPWGEVRYEHMQAIRSKLAEKYAPNSANRHLAAVKGVLREAWRLGILPHEDMVRALDVKAVRGTRLRKGKMLSREERDRCYTAAALLPSPRRERDAAIFAIAYNCGLRRSEIAALRREDYDGKAITVIGKGNKERRVPCNSRAKTFLAAWLAVRGDDEGPMFCHTSLEGIDCEATLTSDGIHSILERIGTLAKVEFSPHDLRRTFISELLDHNVDLSTAQQLAGHANITTTSIYDTRGEKTREDAVSRLED